MRCPRCGDKISEEATYCQSCGEIIQKTTRNFKLEISISVLILLAIFIFIYLQPKPSTYYLKKDIIIEDNTTKYKFNYLDEIQVIKDKKKDNWDVYIDNGKVKIGTVNKAMLFEKESEEYTKAKSEFEKQKAEKEKAENIARQQKEEQAKKEYEAKVKKEEQIAKQKRQADLAKIEPTIKKTFYKISINEYQDMNAGLYDFYIDPYVWINMPYDGKEGAFKLAVLYAKLKTNEIHSDDDYLFATKIKSSSNKSVLAEYSVFSGIKLY